MITNLIYNLVDDIKCPIEGSPANFIDATGHPIPNLDYLGVYAGINRGYTIRVYSLATIVYGSLSEGIVRSLLDFPYPDFFDNNDDLEAHLLETVEIQLGEPILFLSDGLIYKPKVMT